jgi:hypothetical protein
MLARKRWLACVLLLVATATGNWSAGARAQELLPPAPLPVVPPPPSLGRPEPLAPVQPPPTPLAWTPPADVPLVDPGPNGWAPYEPPSTPPGFFFDTEIALLFPILKASITTNSGVATSGNTFQVPSVDLGLAVSPKFEFGYRLPDSCGLFAVSYRFLVTDGTGTETIAGNPFDIHTRLTVQIVDLDYGTAPYEISPGYFIAWRLGARVADIFYDAQLQNPNLVQQGSNTYIGTGPHGRLDVERRIEAVRGLSLFGRLDASVLIGQITQRFHEYVTQPDGSTLASELTSRHSQSCPNLLVQAGISYVPPIFTNIKFTTGYQFEDYFYLGQFNSNGMPGSSRGQLYSNGWFVRGQIDF